MVLLLLTFCLLLLPFWESVIVLYFVACYFLSILLLQSSCLGRETLLLCLVCLPGYSRWLCGSSSQYHGFVCSLWLWYFLIIFTYYFCLQFVIVVFPDHTLLRYLLIIFTYYFCLQFVIVVFPDHTLLRYLLIIFTYYFCLQFVIVVFPDHTLLRYLLIIFTYYFCLQFVIVVFPDHTLLWYLLIIYYLHQTAASLEDF